MSIEELERIEEIAYRNYIEIKRICTDKIEGASRGWQDAMASLGEARKARENAALREQIRAELAMQPAEGQVGK